MAIEFPSSPALYDEFTITSTGQIYYWDGQSWTAKPATVAYASAATTASYALSALSASTSVTIGSRNPVCQVFAYINSVGTVSSGTNLKVNFLNNVINNAGSAWNTASGDYTVQVAGVYRLDGNIRYNSHNAANASYYSIYVTKNGSNIAETRYFPMISYAGAVSTGNVQALTECAVGDVLSFYIFQNSGQFLYVTPSSGSGYISIERTITY